MKTYRIFKQDIMTCVEVYNDGEYIDRKEMISTYKEGTGGILGSITIKEMGLEIPYNAIEGQNFPNVQAALNWMNANRMFMNKDGVAQVLTDTANFTGTQTETTVINASVRADDVIAVTPIGDANSDLTVTNVSAGAFTVTRVLKAGANALLSGLGFSWIRI